MLIRGKDKFECFEHVPPPEDDLGIEALAWHRRILESQNEAMYADAAMVSN